MINQFAGASIWSADLNNLLPFYRDVLGRVATLKDVGNVAAFVASDLVHTMTAATVNISGGTLID